MEGIPENRVDMTERLVLSKIASSMPAIAVSVLPLSCPAFPSRALRFRGYFLELVM
jgi:hypothetical protein